jgi:hypothetical protein
MKTKVITKTKIYPKMPTGVQTRARATSGDDGVIFDPAVLELDPTGNVLTKVPTDGEEEAVAETLRRRAGTPVLGKPSQRRLRLWSSTRLRRLGIARIRLRLIQAPMEKQFNSTTRMCFGCNRFEHTRAAPVGSQICKWDMLCRPEQ